MAARNTNVYYDKNDDAQFRRLSVLNKQLNPTLVPATTTSRSFVDFNQTSASSSATSKNEECNPLDEERARASFPVSSLTHLLDEGEDCTKFKELFMQVLERDLEFKVADKYDQELSENRKTSLQKALRVYELYRLTLKPYQHNAELYERYKRHAWRLLAVADPSLATRFGVHDMLFKGAILSQGHDELQKEYMPLIDTFKVYGCFAMTELGHGSNLRGLETTATYDREADEFVIHSPSDTAAKWWIGGAGQTATHSVVFAQLVIDQKSYGPHYFLVQLRDLDTHKVLPGITVGDVGKKMGRDGIDNGYILFSGVRVPRTHMLMRWAQVSPQGKYSRPPLPQLTYTPILNGRIEVTSQSGYDLQRAVTIAVRFACVRRQFSSDNSRQEQKIMDYQTHQYRLLPWVGAAYAIHFSSLRTLKMYQVVTKELSNQEITPRFNDLHAITAGLKAAGTWMAYRGIDSCRNSLGGHGYSQYSGLPQLHADFAVMCIWEGENHVMALQTSRYLIKSYQQAQKKPGCLSGTVSYLNDAANILNSTCEAKHIQDWLNSDIQIHALKFRASYLIQKVSKRIHHEVTVNKRSPSDAWDTCLVDLIACSQAHVQLYMVETFIQTYQSVECQASKQALKSLCDLFALFLIEENASLLLASRRNGSPLVSYMTADQLESLSEQLRQLMLSVRRDAVSYVDAFNFSDHIINSPVGRFDGRIYEAYFDRVKHNIVNSQSESNGGVIPYFEQVLKPHLAKNEK